MATHSSVLAWGIPGTGLPSMGSHRVGHDWGDFAAAVVWWASLVAQLVKNLSVVQETLLQCLGWEDSLEEGMATHSSILAWRLPMDRRAWRATVHGVAEGRTRLSDWAQQSSGLVFEWRQCLPWLGSNQGLSEVKVRFHFSTWRQCVPGYKNAYTCILMICMYWCLFGGVPGGASGKEPACKCKRLKRCRFDPRIGKIPWRRAWQPTPVFLPAESLGLRSLAGYSPWGHKESDTTEWLSVHAQWVYIMLENWQKMPT